MNGKDDRSNRNTGITKRSLLRNGATAVFVGAFGTTAFSGRAAACDFCPRSPGYWANHWHDTVGDSVKIPMASKNRDPPELTKREGKQGNEGKNEHEMTKEHSNKKGHGTAKNRGNGKGHGPGENGKP